MRMMKFIKQKQNRTSKEDMVTIKDIQQFKRNGISYSHVNYKESDGGTYSTAVPKDMELPEIGAQISKKVLFDGYYKLEEQLCEKEQACELER